ncbi:MAG: dihydrodipicolinate synthase family protein, partial [Candidatus Asgardarchaeia archaeon]
GLECHILGGLLLGADGAVVASANAIPDILVSLYENFTEGNLGEAIKLQQKVNEFFNLFKYGTFPGILKDIMEIMGFQYGKARSPVKSITRKAREEIRFRLKILGLL